MNAMLYLPTRRQEPEAHMDGIFRYYADIDERRRRRRRRFATVVARRSSRRATEPMRTMLAS